MLASQESLCSMELVSYLTAQDNTRIVLVYRRLKYVELVGRYWQGNTAVLRKTPVPVLFCTLRILHGLARNLTHASVLGLHGAVIQRTTFRNKNMKSDSNCSKLVMNDCCTI
jgi:hypothetical protein